MRGSVADRFAQFVERIPESGCHIWTGAIFVGRGYGAFRVREKQKRAHRVSWELAYGEIPDGLQVLHKCDVRCCVNPEHLFLGNQLENMHDMIAKGRKVAVAGDHKRMVNLSQEQAQKVFDDPRSQYVIAAEYGISQPAVNRIKRGKSWPSVIRGTKP